MPGNKIVLVVDENNNFLYFSENMESAKKHKKWNKNLKMVEIDDTSDFMENFQIQNRNMIKNIVDKD